MWFDAEQREFVELARSLSDEQWAAPSWCDAWTVRELIVHVAWHIHLPKYSVKEGVRYLRYGGMDGLYARILDEHRSWSDARLVDWLASAGRPLPANLVELILHQQDIRRPLAIPRPIPGDQLRWLLDFAMTPEGGKETAAARTSGRQGCASSRPTSTGRPATAPRYAGGARRS